MKPGIVTLIFVIVRVYPEQDLFRNQAFVLFLVHCQNPGQYLLKTERQVGACSFLSVALGTSDY